MFHHKSLPVIQNYVLVKCHFCSDLVFFNTKIIISDAIITWMGWESALFVSRVLIAHMARLQTNKNVTTSRPGLLRTCFGVYAYLKFNNRMISVKDDKIIDLRKY